MNKKGFTLIELLAVIAILALVSLIAIPNIVGLREGIKKDQMLDDAKKLISLAKYQVNKNYDIRNSASHTFTLSDLNINNDVTKDPDGNNYISATVTYTKGSTAKYCVYLVSSKKKVCKGSTNYDSCTSCVNEENLYSRSNVVDK